MASYLNRLKIATVLLSAAVVVFCTTASANPYFQQDSLPKKTTDTTKNDTLRFPIHDRRGDAFSNRGRSSFNLKDPSNIRDSIEYDPKTNQYYIIEKVGNSYFRTPTYLTFDELMRIKSQQSEDDYFRQRADVLSALNKKRLRPNLNVTDNLFNRIFGNGKIDIRPQGNVDLTAGYAGQNVQNPTLPESARKNGGFDFQESANISVIGNIGDKLKLPINYNTLANFDFENQLKLDYTGGPDEIIKKIEAGNVSFTTKSTLIASAQSLFGIKAQLQFGKLYVTAVLANQRSQSQSLGLQGGSATTNFQFKADDYEENRHFLLAQYFRNNYNKAMQKLPVVQSLVQILRIEVWVTNRNGATTQARDIVGLMDLGEPSPYNPSVHSRSAAPYPFNDANDEYRNIINDPNSRNSSSATTKLTSLGLSQVQDYEKVFARKLNPTDYYFNPQVGFLSVNQTLQSDDVLGVAYQYSYNGRIYQVGEFSQDVPPDTTLGNNPGAQKVIYLKLLKATSQRTNLPLWGLMMKNVYSLKTSTGAYLSNIQQPGFQLNILYSEPSKGDKRYLPEGDKAQVPLLSVLNLDRLNAHNDPQPDGIFDYLEGFTVLSPQARIIFPLLEPFGHDLDSLAFRNSQGIKGNYVFQQLYDTIKEVAKTYANLDRYIISGVAKGTASSDISLGAFNVPPGSVTVTAGGQTLRENVDYIVDYNLGTVKVLNQALLNSGVPVSVKFENNGTFGNQQRNFTGLRLDYMAKNTATESLTLGATVEKLSERPFFSKTNYNEDPIKNSMYGLDFNYRSQVPEITRLLNKLPFYSTKEMSSINAYGEAAFLKPGHPSQIGSGSNGLIYIDDFEGSTSSIDLRFPLTSWALASTPQNNGLFHEGSLIDSLDYGFNRAKFAWYNIEPVLQDKSNTNNPVRGYENFSDPRVASVNVQQLYPQRTPEFGQAQLLTFDLAYYPTDRGPYNFDARAGSIGPNGKLLNPKTRWGGIMRAVDQAETDFETTNVQYLEFWMQNPFLTNPLSTGGQLYFDLGSVSEDILRDGRRFFENGLNTPNVPAAIDSSSVWGRAPFNTIQVTNAFSNDPSDRPYQDVGFDGLDDAGEVSKFRNYLAKLAATFGTGSPIYQNAANDPSSDDFLNYRDASYDNSKTGILGRYKNINNPQGNSPIASSNSQYISAFTLYPDQEDLNHDNTLNELEEYFEYTVNLVPDSLRVGKNFITDSSSFTANGVQQTWFQFRVPISAYTQKVGNIPDFKSIRFIRMYMSGFSDSVVCRFASMQLVRDQWRIFNYEVDTAGQYVPLPVNSVTSFNLTAVNIEQNSTRSPIPYVIPPGIQRQQQLSNNNVNILLNEQAMSLQVCNLPLKEIRGVFKNTNLDLRRYKSLDMFIHAESSGPSDILNDYDLYAVVRLGSDFINNYYEIRIPLRKTKWYASIDTDIWPDSNNLNLDLQRLVQLKSNRNNSGSSNAYYKETDPNGRIFAMLGNPNLGQVSAFFLGVQNANRPTPVCAEVWFDELRLSGINEKGGYAAVGRVDIKLADLGTMYLSGATRSVGFGSIDQNINERSLDNNTQIDAAANLELGKLLPKKAAISIPFYASISSSVSKPEYDPYDLDIKLQDKLSASPASQRDSIQSEAVDATTIKSFNFTNVRKNNLTGKRLKIWSIENFDFSYSYTQSEHHNSVTVEDELINYKGGLGYNYIGIPKFWEPLKKRIKSNSKWLALIKDFNINPVPSTLTFRADINRQFGAYRARNVGGPKDILPETYNKFFTFDRLYIVRWDITRSINIDFSATNRAWVDEDSGRLDKAHRRQMWDNFWKGGRTVLYQQNANFTYTLPTNKVPLIDWTNFRVGYAASYSWTAASLLATYLGNTLANTQQKNATGELDFSRLYSKWKFLRAMEQTPAPAQNTNTNIPGVNNKKVTDTAKNKLKGKDPNALPELNAYVKAIGRLLTSLKRVSINYSENSSSSIYGYTDSTKIFGFNPRSGEPGLGYIFGQQPDTNFVNNLGKKGLLSRDTTFNFQNQSSFNQTLSVIASLQPVRDLNIDINFNKTFGKNYTELYKDTSSTTGFARLNPYTAGSFSVSFVSFQTLFEKYQPNEISKTFKTFENNRLAISERLGKQNPYSNTVGADGYYKGYGKYAQDVLIPAFIAAYTGKDPQSISLIKQDNANIRSNPFSGYIPKPNWRISYNGLARVPGLDKIFTNFSLTHAYTSVLSMNSFNSALNYQDPFGLRAPGFVDTLTGNLVPYFLVPNITISEQFAPLIDIDMQFVNQLQAKIGFSKSRLLSLSLIDFQLSETHSTEFTFGAGFRKRGVNLPFKIKMPGKKEASKKLDNDLTLRLDFSIRDDASSNSRLDQDAALPVGGQKVVDIAPSIDYVLSNRINIKFYFDQRKVTPKISTSPPITTTRGGVQIRISLAQ